MLKKLIVTGLLGLVLSVALFEGIKAISKAQIEAAPPYVMNPSEPLPANIFVELGKKINPSVVNISVIVGRQNQLSGPRDPFWDFFEEFMGPQGLPPGGPRGRGGPAPRAPQAQSIGTGFVIDASGLILTNNHVISEADQIKVQFANRPEKTYSAEVVGSDRRTDIGLIRIKSDEPLTVAELGISEKTEVGEWVAAFGNPYGHTFSMSKGIISAKSRLIRDLNTIPFLQTDASINPGNSGGPLVNIKGQVIGINSAIDARAQGVGFAIPIDHVKSILPQLKSKGQVSYGWLGVELAPITPQAQDYLGLSSDRGALIMGLARGGPADKGGILPYDVVIEFNKKKVDNIDMFRDAVMESQIGAKAPVVLFREGRKKTLTVVVGESPGDKQLQMRRPEPAPKEKGIDAPFELGFRTAPYSDSLAKRYKISSDRKGPVVVEVLPDSPASSGGLRVGDMILDVNREQVPTVEKLRAVLSKLAKGNIILRVSSGGRTSLVFIERE